MNILVDDFKDGSTFDKGLSTAIDATNLPLQEGIGGAVESGSAIRAIRTRDCPPCAGQKVEVVVDQDVYKKSVGGVGFNQGLDVGIGTDEFFKRWLREHRSS